MKDTIPVLFESKYECCGCAACCSICTKAAIKMKPDSEGFDYPIINEILCIKCYQCIKVCPLKVGEK